jgi:hypothetical protein
MQTDLIEDVPRAVTATIRGLGDAAPDERSHWSLDDGVVTPRLAVG